jgi:hypothetical protein
VTIKRSSVIRLGRCTEPSHVQQSQGGRAVEKRKVCRVTWSSRELGVPSQAPELISYGRASGMWDLVGGLVDLTMGGQLALIISTALAQFSPR